MSTPIQLAQSFGQTTDHVEQARAWLALSESGRHTTALAYAALELRFAIERLAIEYWRALLDRPFTQEEMRTASSFRRIEDQIYKLAGHQREINLHFEFIRALVDELRIDVPVIAPQVGRLSHYWHECSELCHVSWPLVSRAPDLPPKVFEKLTEVATEIASLNSGIRWFTLKDEVLNQLRRDFAAGTASLDDARRHLRRTGAWAKVTYPDGRPSQFVGNPIPPSSSTRTENEA